MADADPRARGLAKLLLTQVTPQVSGETLEVVSKDTTFEGPYDLKSRSMTKQVMLGTTTVVSGMHLELVASAESKTAPDIRERSAAKQVLLGTNATVNGMVFEAISSDGSFKPPGDTRQRSAAKLALVAIPLSIVGSNYTVEALGYGITATPSELYAMEVISGLPYSVPVANFAFETIAKSTIDPPRPAQNSWWFITA